MKTRSLVLCLSLWLISLLPACSRDAAPAEKFHAQITGTKNLTLSGEYAAINGHDGKLYLQLLSRNEPERSIIIHLPAAITAGEYIIYPHTPVTAAYKHQPGKNWETFDENPRGKVKFQKKDDLWQGSFDFTVQNEQDSIHVTGTFRDASSVGDFPDIRETPVIIVQPTQFRRSNTAILLRIFGVILTPMLFFACIAFQIYIGNRVFASARTPRLHALNPFCTYIRGWQDPTLRTMMVIWSVLIFLLGLGLCARLKFPSP